VRVHSRMRVSATWFLIMLYRHRSRSDPPRVSSPSVAYTCSTGETNSIQYNTMQYNLFQFRER
jgi:hypothetical protein